MKKQIALITGITGMDGSHMADFLLEKGYKVYGLVRRSASTNFWRIEHILKDIELVNGDLLDYLSPTIKKIDPDEIYNFAAQSFVQTSFTSPIYTADVTGVSVLRLIEAVRSTSTSKNIKIYQASSSEMFGKVLETPQNEKTPFYPRSPYGCAKAFAHNICVNYRESYKMFISCGICFNHESERRGEEFVTRKITKGVAAIKQGLQKKIVLGNLDTHRDWGYAPDYIEGIWKMLQQDEASDYVLATNETHSLNELLQEAFKCIGIKDYQNYVAHNKKFMRPSEVSFLKGDYSKAKQHLGWEPKTSFKELVKKMVKADIKKLKENK